MSLKYEMSLSFVAWLSITTALLLFVFFHLNPNCVRISLRCISSLKMYWLGKIHSWVQHDWHLLLQSKKISVFIITFVLEQLMLWTSFTWHWHFLSEFERRCYILLHQSLFSLFFYFSTELRETHIVSATLLYACWIGTAYIPSLVSFSINLTPS